MKKIYLAIISLVMVGIISSCSDDFGDMNVPSNATDVVEPKFFLNAMEQGVYNNYQRNVNLYPDVYSQYWANTVSGFEASRYEYVDDWIGNQWSEHYAAMLRRADAMEQMFGENPNYVDAIAIKDIWMCYWWSRMSDTYGDIPYFGTPSGEAVAYTSQEEIYTDLFKVLDNAVTSITGGADQYVYSDGYDLIFDGDVDKWKRFGNSLRLRLAMRISNVNPEQAEAEVKAAIDGPGGLMTSNDDVAKVSMWSEGWYDYINQMGWNWNNIRMSETFSNYCYSESSVDEDPRASIWFAYQRDVEGTATAMTKEEVGKTRYFGLKNGLNTIDDSFKEDYATLNLDGGYVDFTQSGEDAMSCPVMFYSEVQFLLAEAALRGWVSENPNTYYKAGIQASMDYVGVESDDATAYIEGVADLAGSNEAQLKKIITQKWLANFPNGVEGWADFRRTDYPDLTLPAGGVSSSSSVAEGTYVKRIRYPDNEHRLNETNMPVSLNSLDADRMDIRVWWDVSDTKTKSDGLMNSNF
ncbi:SusD/RagB family nutrient-binding outer membrane lipoprotein [Saccharicrinis fermentans]|nr:SusD/RagB family nutrient-binding outer membrane lipoprotein [Saccharicrinis fermentans]